MFKKNDEKKAGSPSPRFTGCISKGSDSSLFAVSSRLDSKLSDVESQEKTAGGRSDAQELPTPAVVLDGGGQVPDPHMLIGGSLQLGSAETVKNQFDSVIFDKKPNKPDISSLELLSVTCDFLSVTVPPETSKYLLSETTLEKVGGGTLGFRQSQFRNCVAGSCLRKFESVNKDCPLAASWGSFESWEFGGKNSVAEIYYRLLSCQTLRPTRIDVAFDYVVPSWFMPQDFIDIHRMHIDSKGFKVGFFGDELVYTCYIGTRKSGLFLRIYRKDLKDISWKQYGCVLRVEIEVRHNFAVDLWDFYLANGKDASFRFAAAYINRMCGFRAIPDDLPELPVIVNTRDSSVALKTYHCINQWASLLHILFSHGVDLPSIVAEKAGKTSRMAKNNAIHLERALMSYGGVDSFVSEVKLLLASV